MAYMARNHDKRCQPGKLVPGTLRIISVRMNYLPPFTETVTLLKQPQQAYISRYALGRDYHKVIRKRLAKLAQKISEQVGDFGYRAFVDSAPVLEKALGEKAGLGWIGKHSLLLDRHVGSWFFLGELYTDLPLPTDTATTSHCGSCQACLDICPTQAIVAPYQVDARRCISYLTIEHKGPIPVGLRSAIGNRIFGCDDCQLTCPWNKFAHHTEENDFHPRHSLHDIKLVELFRWDEATFLEKTQGSPIRRAGYEGWLRNITIGLGNAPYDAHIVAALTDRMPTQPDWLQEHMAWALERQRNQSQQLR